MDKSTKVPKSVLDVVAKAVVSTAVEVLPALGRLILQGASRDQTLEALDHALMVGRRMTTHELMMKRTRIANRQRIDASAEDMQPDDNTPTTRRHRVATDERATPPEPAPMVAAVDDEDERYANAKPVEGAAEFLTELAEAAKEPSVQRGVWPGSFPGSVPE